MRPKIIYQLLSPIKYIFLVFKFNKMNYFIKEINFKSFGKRKNDKRNGYCGLGNSTRFFTSQSYILD